MCAAAAKTGPHESETKYRTLFESIYEGFTLIEMIFDEANKPVDYLFLQANRVFERQTGLAGVVGMTVLEIIPGMKRSTIEQHGGLTQPARSRVLR